jgi:hypothetical protein
MCGSKMEKIIGGIILFIVFIFTVPLLGAAGGYFSGWVVSGFFDESIHDGLRAFGVNADKVPLSYIGAMLGFVGGFFRSNVS